MKNPHRIEPTRFMKRQESEYAINCNPEYGPIFGNSNGSDIHINDYCNKENSCFSKNNGTFGYECDPIYKSSLFVNTNKPNKTNFFSVLDYEVFGINYENRDNINKLCKYADILWEFFETKDISEESLKQVNDENGLLTDFDIIYCDNSSIRVKISCFYLKNPSEFLPDTHIIDKKYDAILRKWIGDYKWKLLYRSSEHGYTAKSFHKYCDNVKGPTLAIIKSSGGWIFGGYTIHSWEGYEYECI